MNKPVYDITTPESDVPAGRRSAAPEVQPAATAEAGGYLPSSYQPVTSPVVLTPSFTDAPAPVAAPAETSTPVAAAPVFAASSLPAPATAPVQPPVQLVPETPSYANLPAPTSAPQPSNASATAPAATAAPAALAAAPAAQLQFPAPATAAVAPPAAAPAAAPAPVQVAPPAVALATAAPAAPLGSTPVPATQPVTAPQAASPSLPAQPAPAAQAPAQPDLTTLPGPVLVPPTVDAEARAAAASATNAAPASSAAETSAAAPAAFESRRDLSLEADPDLDAALQKVLMTSGSDLHVTVGAPPMIRVDGALRPIEGAPVWNQEKVSAALHSILSPAQRAIFEEHLEFDFAYTLSANARFRVNFYQQRNNIGAAFRLIPTEIKPLAALGVPDSIGNFAKLPRGLVLVTGPTGSGKSTTLAAIIDLVNRTRTDHIMTVEDPIEFLHSNHKSLVNQREVGHDTHSFAAALKHVLRQDPDVILVGELRDLETISVALTAAETGHLVFATLHTQDAPQTIDRIIDVYPPHQQGQVRAQLAATLQGVVCQTLVKRASGKGRVVATEVLIATHAVANLIREGKTYQVHSAMQAGRDLGMHTMDQHLADLVNGGQITFEAAEEKAHDLEVLKRLVNRTGSATGAGALPGEVNYGDDYSTSGYTGMGVR